MTKPDGVAPEATTDGGASPSWGTWEELILAFAVNRHGTTSWDSVASELQKRTSDPNLPLTAHDCRSKYLDLKRRFPVAPNHVSDGGGGGDVKSGAEESAGPLLEELRRLRVAELRREVERYDLNIESLELKVKRMEEERERSLQEKSASDLENKDMAKRVVDPEAEPGDGGGPAVEEEIDKDQLSVNESNSTDPEAEKPKTGEKAAEPAAEGEGLDQAGQIRHEPVEVKTEPDRKSGGLEEDSFNGSSNSIEKSDRRVKKKPVGLDAGSHGREEAAKESSDVQSTASRSRKAEGGGGDKVRRGNTIGDEGEHEDQSRAVKELSAQSQPLIDFLQVLRAHKLGSMFQRRLRSQETSKYQKLILQHVDLETVEKRLRQGRYSGSRPKFFRDLLLLVNNALVFFPNNSPESKAARVIRALVSKEMSKSKSKSESSSGKQISLQSLSKKDKSADNNSNSLMLKPRLPSSLAVCRKRSSIASKASDKKGQSSSSPANEKFSKKAPESLDEPKITKKRTRENRLSPATPSTTKTNGKNSSSNNNNNNNNNNTTKQQEKGGGSSSEHSKKTAAEPESKKRGAANFLSRMKQGSSPSNNGDLLNALKNTPLTGEGSGNGGGPTEKKKGVENAKRVEKKEQVTRRNTAETRLAKEKGSPVKNVGRPPKRAAPPARKRGRERSENETPPAKKRTRKL